MLYSIVIVSSCDHIREIEVECNTTQKDTSFIKIISQITYILSDIKAADSYRYHATDDVGNSLDCMKITSYQNDTFIGIYHTFKDNTPMVNLAKSTDLIHWEYICNLGENASQPTIFKMSDNGYVVAWEQEPHNHIRILWYEGYDDLIHNHYKQSRVISHTLSPYAEGTPNIYTSNTDSTTLGFHYYASGIVDRQAKGVLVSQEKWQVSKEYCLDGAILQYGVQGNIGDRDNFTFLDNKFLIIEGQSRKNDFGTWKCYLYHNASGMTIPLHHLTHHNSSSFANPTVSILEYQGHQIVFASLFLPSETAGIQEAGELIYYKII